jgi:hypothetical protein
MAQPYIAMVTSLKVQPNRNTHFGLRSKWKPSTLFRSIKKFMGQLNKIFNNETVDLVHVSERIQAAFGYFLKPMDELVLKSCGN